MCGIRPLMIRVLMCTHTKLLFICMLRLLLKWRLCIEIVITLMVFSLLSRTIWSCWVLSKIRLLSYNRIWLIMSSHSLPILNNRSMRWSSTTTFNSVPLRLKIHITMKTWGINYFRLWCSNVWWGLMILLSWHDISSIFHSPIQYLFISVDSITILILLATLQSS